MSIKLIPTFFILSLAICFSLATINACPNQEVEARAIKVGDDVPIVTAYLIKDLPLYASEGKELKPKLLIAFIKMNLDQGLPPGTEPARVVFDEKSKSLVIVGTKKNHARTSELLNELREE